MTGVVMHAFCLSALLLAAVEPPRIDLTVLDAESGKPLEKATVRVFNGVRPTPYVFTDAAGRTKIEYPHGGFLTLDVHTTRHIQQRVTLKEFNPLPSTMTLKLRRGTRTAGGLVVDEAGKPVANATVRFGAYLGQPVKSPGLTELVCDIDAVTDAAGRWSLKVLDQSPTDLRANARHSGFAYDHFNLRRLGSHEFLSGQATLLLRRGIEIYGAVRDEQKQPIVGASVVATKEHDLLGDLSPLVHTGADGGFRLRVNAGSNTLTVQAAGHSPVMRTFHFGEKPAEISMTMKPGRSVRGRVADEKGRPIAGVYVTATFEGTRSRSGLRLGDVTDADGGFLLRNAPADSFHVSAYQEGFTSSQAAVPASRDEVSLVIKPMGGKGPGGLVNSKSLMGGGARKRRKGEGVIGVVKTADGRPAVDGIVVLHRQKDDGYRWFRERRVVNEMSTVLWHTDESGSFNLPFQGLPFALGVSHSSGWAIWRPKDERKLREPPEIKLTPWATITGVFLLDGNPAPNHEIRYDVDRYSKDEWDTRSFQFQAIAKTDADGRFVLSKVPAKPGRISRYIPLSKLGQTTAFIAAVEPKAGEVLNVGTVRQRGRTVVGRLKLPKELQPREDDYDIGFVCVPLDAQAVSDRPPAPIPKELEGKSRKERTDWLFNWQATPEAAEYRKSYQRLRIDVEPNGRFRIDGAQADSLVLTIKLRDPRSTFHDRRDVLAEATKRFVVPAMSNGYDDAPLDLGELEVAATKATLTGKRVSDFAAKGLDGKSWRLAFEKGNVVLLDFWASWCGPCIEAFPEVAELHEELGPKGLVIVGLSVDDEAEDAAKVVTAEKCTWRQVHLGPKSPNLDALGVEAFPTYIVLDRMGKVRYRGNSVQDAGRAARSALANGF